MSRIDCPNQDTLSDFVLGKLAIHEQGTVAEHLDACTECEQRAGELDAMADGVVSVLRRISGPVPGAGDDMTEAAGTGSNADGDLTAVAHPHHAGDLPSSTEPWGEFRIVREIGRGGMGVVCEAFQGSLNRHVALKFLPEHGNLARFRREAQAAGRLHHTNIVPVFGVGEQDGRHFYVMQYIAGRGLDAVLAERAESASGSGRSSGRPGAREAARIGAQVAGALAYAHNQGVIHRDIKPSNLLLDDQGAVWVTDFGLAKVADQQDLTGTGDLLGTLRYMPPEAFEGRYDARGDIYALGLTLYELLALRPAYDEADRASLIRLVTSGDPPRLRDLDYAVPRDLETVIHKAIERDPAHRYATAAQLADDLGRFLEDRPVLARRTGPLGRALRWCRRNKSVAALLAALVLVFLGGFAGVTAQWLRADAEAARANTTAKAEIQARAAESKLRVRAQSEIAERNLDHALEFARRGDVDYALLWMAEALEQVPAERPEIARMLRANLGGWEGQVLRRRAFLDQPVDKESFARFRPDGRVILTGSDKGTARFWETATGRPLCPPLDHHSGVTCCAFSPDGRLAATGGADGLIRFWESTTGEAAGPALNHRQSHPPVGSVDLLDFSPDGRLLVSSDLQAGTKLWEVASGRRLELPKGVETSHVTRFSPDGRRLYLLDRKARQARTWDRTAGQMVGATIASDRVHWAIWSPDGRLIVTGDGDETGQVWDAATGRLVAALPETGNHFKGATFSPDGRWLLTHGNDGTARIWDVVNRRPVGIASHDGGDGAAFSPDGRLILTAGGGKVQLWDRATGHSIGAPLRNHGPIKDASFSPDGRLVLTASEDATAHVTDISRNDLLPLSDRAEYAERAAGISAAPLPGRLFPEGQFSPDGSRVVLADHHLARVVETETGQPIGSPVVSRWRYAHLAIFSPDGRRIATYAHDFPYRDGGSTWSTCQVRDAGTGRPVSPLLPHGNWLSVMAFRTDGEVLATGDYSGVVHRWDVKTGAMIGHPFAAGGIVSSLAFSPDGRLLAAGSASPGNQMVLWDLESGAGRPRGDPVRFTNLVGHLAFSQDGTRLAAASGDHTVRIIETIDARPGVTIRLNGRPRTLTFTPDGCHIVTNGDRMDAPSARLWDVVTGEPLSPPASQSRIVSTPPVYLADFANFAIGNGDGTVRLWDIATARPIGAGWSLRQPCRAVSVGRDGRSLTAVDHRGNVRTWPIPPPATGPVEGLVRHLRARTGRELDSSKTIVAIDSVWKSIRDEARDARATAETADEQEWHEACARDAETMGDGFGARWHLDRLIAARGGTGLLHARRARTWLWSGDANLAGDDFERAIALGPRDRVLDWMLHCAEDFGHDRRPVDAVRLLDRVAAARPDDWLTFALRAEHLIKLGRMADREADLERAIERGAEITFLIRIADERSRAGRWAEAAGIFDRAIAMGTVPYEVWMQAATAHLEIGDEPGFRRVCDKMRAWAPAEILERWVAASLVDLATLGPGGVGDDGKLFGWIEPSLPSVAPAQKQWKRGLLQILGAVHFRAGKYSEAIARLKESIAMADGAVAPEVAAFMAMAHFRMGEPAKARAQLGVPWRDEPDSPTAEDWWAWRGRRLLRLEATRLILDPDFPANPFAR